MRWVFGAGLLAGVALLLTTLAFGLNARMRIAASSMSAFGIAGMSAAYAGWPLVATVAASLTAAGFFGWYARAEDT